MTRNTRGRTMIGIGGLLLLSAGGPAAQAPPAVAITYAAPDPNQTTLFVSGENFTAGASVYLAGIRLNGVIVDAFGKSITAQLPPSAPAGAYLLQVSNGTAVGQSAVFVVLLSPVSPVTIQPTNYNSFVGPAGNSTMSGGANTGFGAYSLSSNTTGQNNMASGVSALAANTTGNNNTASGMQALFSNKSGSSNTASGVFTLYSNTTGSYNTAVGENALFANTSGEKNTGVGWYALRANTTGIDNTAFGKGGLMNNATGSYNTSIGVDALAANKSGDYNLALGIDALYRNTTGFYNVADGPNALVFNLTGSQNTASGMSALYSNSTGNGNTGVGYAALKSNVGGHQITAVGYLAGGSVTGSNFSTFLGNMAGFDARQNVDPYNSMALGNGSYTTKNNQVVIGNANIVETLLRGNVGIGSAAPSSKLEVDGTADAKAYKVGGVVGVSCSGAPTANFTVVNGIVTRC